MALAVDRSGRLVQDCFYTKVDNPRCGRLKSAMEQWTDSFDSKRRLDTEHRHMEQQWAQDCQHMPSNLPEQVGMIPGRGAFSQAIPSSRPGSDSASASGASAHPSSGGGEEASARGGAGDGAGGDPAAEWLSDRHPRPVGEWLHGSLRLARQAQAHATFTGELRSRTRALKKLTDTRAREGRKDTNNELRAKVRATEQEKQRIEATLREAAEEHRILGQVKQFVAELKTMVEAGPLAGCEMRAQLRASRPRDEHVLDAVHDALEAEKRCLSAGVDTLERMVQEADDVVVDLATAQTALYGDLEDKVEGLRIDEQCLVLDGSTSQKPHMGGTAAHQPPLDIVLDVRAKNAIQGFDSVVDQCMGPEDGDPALAAGRGALAARPPTKELLEFTSKLVLRSVALRRDFKRKLTYIDTRSRRHNKAVEEALCHKVKAQCALLRSLDDRIVALRDERQRLEEQMHFVRAGLDEKNKEKDIVCKRLRLRQQRPAREDIHDKVQDALEKEYDILTEAVQEFSSKLNHITLEVSRMHETLRLIEQDSAAKRTAWLLEKSCLELPFSHTVVFPHELYNNICSSRSFVYGVHRDLEKEQDDAEAAKKAEEEADEEPGLLAGLKRDDDFGTDLLQMQLREAKQSKERPWEEKWRKFLETHSDRLVLVDKHTGVASPQRVLPETGIANAKTLAEAVQETRPQDPGGDMRCVLPSKKRMQWHRDQMPNWQAHGVRPLLQKWACPDHQLKKKMKQDRIIAQRRYRDPAVHPDRPMPLARPVAP